MTILLLGTDHAKADAYRRAGSRLPNPPCFRYERSTTPRAISRQLQAFRGEVPTVVWMDAVAYDKPMDLLAEARARIVIDPPFWGFPVGIWKAIDVIERAPTWILPLMPLRLLPVIQRVKAIVAASKLGQLLYLKASYHERPPAAPELYSDALEMRGCHAIDLVRWLMDSDFSDVQVVSDRGSPTSTNSRDDLMILSFRMEDKSYATVDISWSLPPAYPKPAAITIEITGTKGSIRCDALNQTLQCYGGEASRELNWGSDIRTEALRLLTDASCTEPPATLYDLGNAQSMSHNLMASLAS